MQDVAHLLALAAPADVLQSPAGQVVSGPQGNEPLLHGPHLPRTRDDAAPVDHVRDAVERPVLGEEQLRRQLGGTVEGADTFEGERLGDPPGETPGSC